jgi:arsenite-transporting ATPase
VLLFTGKGGVGKTTLAAATAVRAAAAGARVLVTSTDPAHSLADAFGVHLGDDGPQAVGGDRLAGHLEVQQLDAHRHLERSFGDVRDYLVRLLTWGGLAEVAAEELLLVPGLEELVALLDLRDRLAAGDHDVLVVDCAPTAETLALLSLPEVLRWYVTRLLAPGRALGRVVRPVSRALAGDGVPLPSPDLLPTVEALQAALEEVHALLRDPARSSVRLVTTADRVVLAETQRTATSVSVLGYPLDAVLVNRVLPDAVVDPYLAGWKHAQGEVLAQVHERFAPVPVVRAELAPREPIGVDALAALADAVYGDLDPTAVLYRGEPVVVRDRPGGPVLSLAVPFATDAEVALHRRDDELTVHVGAVRRTLLLPATLRRRTVTGAALVDGRLEVAFTAASTHEHVAAS